MDTASATRSAAAGFTAESDAYNLLSAGRIDSLEMDVNPGSETTVIGRMAGAAVAAGAGASVAAAGASVAAGAAGAAGFSVAAGAGAPQDEINKTTSKIKIAMKDFRDIKAPTFHLPDVCREHE
jgi:outer membrane lipoprotein SlyB